MFTVDSRQEYGEHPTFNSQKRTEKCGADRGRTDGLLVANEALSQLSYSPEPKSRGGDFVV
jgi:hypothetical protein